MIAAPDAAFGREAAGGDDDGDGAQDNPNTGRTFRGSAVMRPLAMMTGMSRAVASSIKLGQTSSSMRTMTDGRTRVSVWRTTQEKSSG
jgi:hypothetical protein